MSRGTRSLRLAALAVVGSALGAALMVGTPPVSSDPLPGGLGPCLPAGPPVPGLPNCPTPTFPPFSSPSPVGIDNNVNVFVGGDLSIVDTAAEAEGKVVVLGNVSQNETATQGGATYNVGVVGVGSHIVPAPSSDHFVVGGTTTTANEQRIIVGTAQAPGNFRHAGAVVAGAPPSGVEVVAAANDITDPDATDPYVPLRDQLSTASTEYAKATATGTVANAGFESVFTGTNASDLEVFEVTGNLTNGGGPGGAAQDLRFTGIDPNATVLINVLGTNPVINETTFAGLPNFQNVLWNFPQATDVQVLGSSQFPGALLAGVQTSTLTLKSPGQNGRVFATGNLVHGGTGSEIHNYSSSTDDLPPPAPPTTATITITKTATGGDDTFTFTEATLGQLDVTTTGGTGSNTYIDVPPGTYDIDEVATADWVALGGPFGGDCAPNGTITVVAGQDASCTITNLKRSVQVTVVKQTDPPGDPTAFDFLAVVVNPSTSESFQLTDGTSRVVLATPGPSAPSPNRTVIQETVPAGWVLTAVTGTGCTRLGTSPNVRIDGQPGDSITCIFTNTKLPTLRVTKVTDPATAADSFSFAASGGSIAPTSATLANGAAQTFTGLVVGTTYTVTETVPSGWALSVTGTGCTLNAAGTGIEVTPVAGQALDCTFTNTKLPRLTLAKTVTNDDGGTAQPDAWTLAAAGPTPISGPTGDAAVTDAGVSPGTYTLSESGGPSGYTAAGWTCTDGTLTGDVLVLAGGDDATCTLVNDDDAPVPPTTTTTTTTTTTAVPGAGGDGGTAGSAGSPAGGSSTGAASSGGSAPASMGSGIAHTGTETTDLILLGLGLTLLGAGLLRPDRRRGRATT
jgi:choice-of-anchor A domain-containing protein